MFSPVLKVVFLSYLWFLCCTKNILKCLLIYLAPADLSCCTWDPLYIIQDLLLQSTESLVVARRLDGRVARASEHVGSGVVAPAFLF